MRIYYLHCDKEEYFRTTQSRIQLALKVDDGIEQYDSNVNYVSDLLPRMHVAAPVEDLSEEEVISLEKTLKSFDFVEDIEQAPEVKIS